MSASLPLALPLVAFSHALPNSAGLFLFLRPRTCAALSAGCVLFLVSVRLLFWPRASLCLFLWLAISGSDLVFLVSSSPLSPSLHAGSEISEMLSEMEMPTLFLPISNMWYLIRSLSRSSLSVHAYVLGCCALSPSCAFPSRSGPRRSQRYPFPHIIACPPLDPFPPRSEKKQKQGQLQTSPHFGSKLPRISSAQSSAPSFVAPSIPNSRNGMSSHSLHPVGSVIQ